MKARQIHLTIKARSKAEGVKKARQHFWGQESSRNCPYYPGCPNVIVRVSRNVSHEIHFCNHGRVTN